MIDRDDPRHRIQLRFVHKGFTPKATAEQEGHVRSIVTSLIDAVANGTSCRSSPRRSR